MKALARLAFYLTALWITTLACYAQTPATIAVTGHLGDLTNGTNAAASYNYAVKFQLAYCLGNNAAAVGQQSVANLAPVFLANPTTGQFSGNLWPNDVISCGTSIGATRYMVTKLRNNVPVGAPQCYQLLSSQNPFNLDVALPCPALPPPTVPGNSNAQYVNLTLQAGLFGNTGLFTGALNAQSTNGALNAAMFPGATIVEQTMAAQASLACANHCTIRVPAGTYNTSATLFTTPAGDRMHGWTHLELDPGTVINFTPTASAPDAIHAPLAPAGNDPYFELSGGQVNCSAKTNGTVASSGVVLYPSNHTSVHGMVIHGCGVGLINAGANAGDIFDMLFDGNDVGIWMYDLPAYAPNAIHIHDSGFSSNGVGLKILDTGAPALNNDIYDNTFEGNLTGDVQDSNTYGDTYRGNYFESPGVSTPLNIGVTAPSFATSIHDNYFTVGSGTAATIHVYGLASYISDNREITLGTFPKCFLDFALFGEHPRIGPNFTTAQNDPAHSTESELCLNGTPTTALAQGWQNWIPVGEQIQGNVDVTGHGNFAGPLTTGGLTANFETGASATAALDEYHASHHEAWRTTPVSGFCTPGAALGDVWHVTGDPGTGNFQNYVCTADSVAPGGGAQGHPTDGNGTWVGK